MKIRQHEAIRVPQGWSGQEKTLIIQLENIFNDLYRIADSLGVDLDALRKAKADKVEDATDGNFASLDENGNLEDSGHCHDDYVTDVSFDSTTNELSVTIADEETEIATLATLDGNGKIPASQLPSYVDDVEEYEDTAHFPITGESDKIYVALDTGFTYRWSGTLYVRLNTYDEATQSNSGLMSAADKTKLDGVAEGATANIGTITSVKMNGSTVSTSGEADLGTVITSHQDISGKADKVTSATNDNFASLDANGNLKDSGHKHSDYLTQHQDISGKADKATTVTSVEYNSSTKKITKTINGTTTDVVAVSAIKSDLGAFTWGQLANQ